LSHVIKFDKCYIRVTENPKAIKFDIDVKNIDPGQFQAGWSPLLCRLPASCNGGLPEIDSFVVSLVVSQFNDPGGLFLPM
jgi:hypothetical protein